MGNTRVSELEMLLDDVDVEIVTVAPDIVESDAWEQVKERTEKQAPRAEVDGW